MSNEIPWNETGLDRHERADLWVFLKERLEEKGCGCELRTGQDTRFIHSREWAASKGIEVDRMHLFNETMGWMNCDHEICYNLEYVADLKQGPITISNKKFTKQRKKKNR